jgi:hypothetical protein
MKNDLIAVAKNNVKLAKEKLTSASKLYDDPDTVRTFGMVIGMSVELSLKAIISACGEPYQKTHHLNELMIKAQSVSKVSLSIFSDLLETEDFIVKARYEYDGEWEVREPERILELAGKLIYLCEDIIEEKENSSPE